MIDLDLCQAHYQIVDNPSHGLHNNKYINCKSFLDDMVFKDDQLIFRCFECKKKKKKKYMRDFNKDLSKHA